MSIPTEITIHPYYAEEPVFGVRTNGDTDQISRSDVAKAANPLHQIPFVSQVYEAVTGDSGSAAAKLIGGAIIGGPIGFLASLATVIFEQESGQSVIGAVASAFNGDSATTQLASNSPAPHLVEAQEGASIAMNTNTMGLPLVQGEVLPPIAPAVDAQKLAAIGQKAQMQLASAVTDARGIASFQHAQDKDVLDLFGGQPLSAHQSYQKAQMLPYLRDVNTSLVM